MVLINSSSYEKISELWVIEGDNQVKKLFDFVQKHAEEFEAYEMEKNIFSRLMKKKREPIEKAILYFENHRKWMRYDEYLQAGYPIGSGVVESSCGHTVKDRMEGSGRRWSIKGAESTLLLRSVYTSNHWDDYSMPLT